MKKLNAPKKLVLNKETLADLDTHELEEIAGGLHTDRFWHTCWTCPDPR